jgi:excinuclease UvrABC nuclease subunit
MLIDGGKPQLNAVLKILWESDFPQKVRLPKVAALAKREEELYIQERKTPIKLSTLPQNVALFFQRVRDESHRFAKKYHHKLREISYRQ